MFRTVARLFLPNPFDWMLKRTARRGGRRILLCWNRGLGDIALGLYAMVLRIKELVPKAEITFLTRENLRAGFSMLEGVTVLTAPEWKRGELARIPEALRSEFDLVIEKPNPTDWVRWQRGKVTPRLQWSDEGLYQKFGLESSPFVGVQVSAETNHGLWRNWPLERWQELFNRLERIGVRVLLFGYGKELQFKNQNVIDLRGKTTLFELLSIIKNRCMALVLPDSGVASMTYYLDTSFPLRLITLWADPNHGILKQNVASPNPQLIHRPVIAEGRNLATVSVDRVMKELFPVEKVGAILLAGGAGSRLGQKDPKGMCVIGGKTLFQWVCEKLPKKTLLAVMTSPLNHEETVAYFQEQRFFGLEVHFFQQEMLPLLDRERRPLKEKGPNGNGGVFRSFVKAGLKEIFAKRGVDTVTVSNVDNPLTDPLDPELIACLRFEKADAVAQCIERQAEDRAMGVIVEREGKMGVVEYTDLDPEQEYKYAYSGQMAFDFSFFCKMAEVELPLHWIWKNEAWKGELFLFDVLSYASRARRFVVSRQTHYAPVKSREHVDSVARLLKGKR